MRFVLFRVHVVRAVHAVRAPVFLHANAMASYWTLMEYLVGHMDFAVHQQLIDGLVVARPLTELPVDRYRSNEPQPQDNADVVYVSHVRKLEPLEVNLIRNLKLYLKIERMKWYYALNEHNNHLNLCHIAIELTGSTFLWTL